MLNNTEKLFYHNIKNLSEAELQTLVHEVFYDSDYIHALLNTKDREAISLVLIKYSIFFDSFNNSDLKVTNPTEYNNHLIGGYHAIFYGFEKINSSSLLKDRVMRQESDKIQLSESLLKAPMTAKEITTLSFSIYDTINKVILNPIDNKETIEEVFGDLLPVEKSKAPTILEMLEYSGIGFALYRVAYSALLSKGYIDYNHYRAVYFHEGLTDSPFHSMARTPTVTFANTWLSFHEVWKYNIIEISTALLVIYNEIYITYIAQADEVIKQPAPLTSIIDRVIEVSDLKTNVTKIAYVNFDKLVYIVTYSGVADNNLYAINGNVIDIKTNIILDAINNDTYNANILKNIISEACLLSDDNELRACEDLEKGTNTINCDVRMFQTPLLGYCTVDMILDEDAINLAGNIVELNEDL